MDDNHIWKNPIMRGYIKLNNQLESLTYEDAHLLESEITIKLKICEVLDYFLDQR